MPGRTGAEWPAFEGGLWQGRVFGKGKCSAGSFGYHWKGFLSATQRSRAEQLSFIFFYLSHHNGKTVSKKHVTGIFPGKEGLNNCNPIPEEEDA